MVDGEDLNLRFLKSVHDPLGVDEYFADVPAADFWNDASGFGKGLQSAHSIHHPGCEYFSDVGRVPGNELANSFQILERLVGPPYFNHFAIRSPTS